MIQLVYLYSICCFLERAHDLLKKYGYHLYAEIKSSRLKKLLSYEKSNDPPITTVKWLNLANSKKETLEHPTIKISVLSHSTLCVKRLCRSNVGV